ncbi:MAG: DUF11 domain-containing protein [Planctomycetes bacterium]|nr:DUF11 domain-containing protein [Planctomycetota bacterium]
MPPELSSPYSPLNMRLSPTRDYLFSAGGSLGGCPNAGRRLRIYSIPPAAGQPLVLLFEDCLPCTPNDGNAPLWYDEGITQGGFSGQPPVANGTPLSLRRIAYVRTNASSSGCGTGQPQLRFYDLVNLTSAVYDLGLLPGAGVSLVSPGGEYMIFQHDLTNNPADSDIAVLSLCSLLPLNEIHGSPPVLDNVNIVGIHARVASSGGGTATVEILDGTSAVRWTGMPACCSSGYEPLGSCCVNNNCSVTTQANCAGVWVAGASCVNSSCVPTQPDPRPAINAPSPVTVGDAIAVPITVTNMGQTAASAVVVTLTWTSQTFSFVSASNGGAQLPSNPASVRWNLPTLAPGASVNLTANLTTGCFTGPQSLQVAVTATGVSQRTASQSTQVNARPPTPVTVTVTSVPAVPLPLRAGDLITHTITVANPGSIAVPVVTLSTSGSSITPGRMAVFDAIQDCGGATVCELFNQGGQMRWTASLAAGQSRSVVVTTRIIDCFDPSFPATALGQGLQIFALDACGATLGVSSPPQTIVVAPALEASLYASNLQPGVIGTPSVPSPGGNTIQPVRGTPNLLLSVNFTNKLATQLDLGDISIPLPAGWTVSTPPNNGAAYDSNTNAVTFTRVLSSGGSTEFQVGIQPDLIDASHNTLTIGRLTPACGRSVGGLVLINTPPVPGGPYVLSANRFFGAPITIIERGVDSSPRDFLTSGGSWTGIAASDTGDLWLFGEPLTLFNPDTLAFGQFAQANAFARNLPQQCELVDGAFQASTGDVIIYARATAAGATSDALLRLVPTSGDVSVVAEVPRSFDEARLGEVFVDGAGDILYCNHESVIRYPGARGPQLPPNSGTPLAIPHPVYTNPDYGTLLAQRVWTIAPLCDGTLAVLHNSEFDHPAGLQFADRARVYAVSVFDPATGTIREVDPLFAGEAGSGGFWSVGGSLAPTFQISHVYPFEAASVSWVQGEPGEVISGNDSYPAFHTVAIDLATGALTFMQNPTQFGFKSALDVVYRQPASTACGTVCVGDFNQDGGVDGVDVQDFFAAWGAGDPAADVNADGGVDGSDVAYFFLRWQAGC